MNTIKLHLMNGDSITRVVDAVTTLYDIILDIPDSNDFIYSVFAEGCEDRININTLINTLYYNNPLFLLKTTVSGKLKTIYDNSSSNINIHDLYYKPSLYITYYCYCLQPLSDLIHLTDLNIIYSHNTDISQLQSVKYLVNLNSLTLTQCFNLSSLDDIQYLKQIKMLSISEAPRLIDIYHIQYLDKLSQLSLCGCHILTDISYINHLIQLEKLYLYTCINIYNIESIQYLSKLQTLDLYNCKSIYDISPLYGMLSIEELTLYTDKHCIISNIEIIETLKNIKSLKLQCNENTNTILYTTQILEKFHYLEKIQLYNCSTMKDIILPAQLLSLYLYKCNINSLYSIKHITGLQSLVIIFDTSILKDYPLLSGVMNDLTYIECFINLINLRFDGLYETDVLKITELDTLKRVHLRDCINIKNIDKVENMNKLGDINVDIEDCYKLYDDGYTMSFDHNSNAGMSG